MCYEDQRSTILAVDNFNGIKVVTPFDLNSPFTFAIKYCTGQLFNNFVPQVLGRTIRVDHVANYKAPKDSKNIDEETRRLRKEGCAPKNI